jgi:hypothetical protein
MTDDGPASIAPIRIGGWFQGPTGVGQGGWTAHRFAAQLPGAVTTAIRAPIPLETDLAVAGGDGRWELVGPDGTVHMIAASWEPEFPDPDPIGIDEAIDARRRFGELVTDHPVPFCFSCGVQHDSMNVHAGPIGNDRFATDWSVPAWAVGADGRIDSGALWAAIDCCAAWWVGYSRAPRIAYTVQFAVEELHPLEAGATYALVGWSGGADPEWDGRKRHAASAAFDADGRCVARSVSFWVST